MNKYFLLGATLMVALGVQVPAVAAAQGAGSGAGAGAAGSASVQTTSGDQDRTQDRTQTQDPTTHTDGTEYPIQDQDRDGSSMMTVRAELLEGAPVWAQNAEQLRESIQMRARELAQIATTSATTTERQREMIQNNNRVREAVHAFLSAENLVGGIGQQVSEIAQQMNEHAALAFQAEERIQTRNAFMRFFLGGDVAAAQQIEQSQAQLAERTQQMTQLLNQCTDCSEEVRTMLQEQVQTVQQERERLQQAAEDEMNNYGLFGFFVRLFMR